MAKAGRKPGQNKKYRTALDLVEADFKVKKLATKEFLKSFKEVIDVARNSTNANLRFGANKMIMEIAKQYLKEQGKKIKPSDFIEDKYGEKEDNFESVFSTDFKTGTDDK